MFTAIAILAAIAIAAAVTFALIAAFEFDVVDVSASCALQSCGLWENLMIYLHPNTVSELAVTAMFHALPFLALISVWLSTKSHLMRCVVCLVWIVCLFLVEEMFLPNVELLPSGVFVAVIALSVFHMLAFLRIHVFAYYTMFFAGKIIGFTLRLAFRPLIGIVSCVIISPLIMHMLIEEVVNPFIHIACQYNIHSFGLFVVGASFSCHVMKKIVSLARCFFWWIVALNTIYFTTAQYPILWDILAMIGFLAISAATVLAIVAALESLAIVVRRVLAWLLHKGRQMLSQLLRTRQPVVDLHQDPLRPVVDTPAPDHVFSITWSDDLPSSHLPFQPHTDGQSVSCSWYLPATSYRRNQQRLSEHAGKMKLVLSEIGRLVKQVFYVDKDPSRREHFRQLCRRVDGNYALEDRAQSALAELTLLYNELKEKHPKRFRSWSNHHQLYEDCLLFEQGMDIIMLEIKLKAEFDRNEALELVADTMAETEEVEEEVDEAADPTEANAPDDIDALLDVEERRVEFDPENDEAATFDIQDVDGVDVEAEEAQAPFQPPARRRRRCRNEAASLATQLGEYWKVPPTARRRSMRVRREPQWYKP